MKHHAPLNILLADDDKNDCIFFDTALKELLIPTHLSTVHDGEQLMSYLSENSHKLPDVIFLDLCMPRKNGFECLKEIKENKKLKDLFVVMFLLSYPQDKNYEQTVIEMLLNMGARHHIIKTGDLVQLKSAIHDPLNLVVEHIRPNL